MENDKIIDELINYTLEGRDPSDMLNELGFQPSPFAKKLKPKPETVKSGGKAIQFIPTDKGFVIKGSIEFGPDDGSTARDLEDLLTKFNSIYYIPA